jgi:hypothetical protein
MEANEDRTGQAERVTSTPAEAAMTAILATLDRFFDGQQTPGMAMAAISQISGRYKMEAIS